MKRNLIFVIFSTVLCLLSQIVLLAFAAEPVHLQKVKLFSLADVKLGECEFKHIQDLTHKYLLTLEPDRLLSWFRREAGLTPKAAPYPYWESDGIPGMGPLPGHSLGFYLSSMSMLYETTTDPEVLTKLEYTIKELDVIQTAGGDGYLAATTNGKHVFEDVAEGKFRTSGMFINDCWEPVYVMNKIMLGLYGVHTRCQSPLAKKILVRMADWFGENVIDKLSEEDMQKLLLAEHGSIAESYIDVYSLTGDSKYLNWAKRLNDDRMLLPASEGRDILAGWHANTQIPKFTGFERVFAYTGDKKYTDAARFFWERVVSDHTWAMGGNSTGEHFFPKQEYDTRVLQESGPESCNSVNMLRLTEFLYQGYAEPEKVDYYERVLFNHILSNYEPERGMCTYFTSLRPGGYRIHATEHDSFWCCTGTGFESPTKFTKLIYSHDSDSLYVNLFIPSTLHWKEKLVTLQQTTGIPDEEQTTLLLKVKKPVEFSLKIRHPYWVEKGKMSIKVNGEDQRVDSRPSTYVEIRRQWQTGDTITVQLPMHLSVLPLTESERFVAIAYGPVILGARVDSSDRSHSDFWNERSWVAHHIPLSQVPSLVGSLGDITKDIEKASTSPLTFITKGLGFPTDLTLIPFYRTQLSRYVVYFRHFDNAGPLREEKRLADELDARTVDQVYIADSASEKLHKIEAVQSQTGTTYARYWRDALRGGYFMYELKCLPNEEQELYLLFDGTDAGTRVFDILVDGKAVETIDYSKPVGDGLYSHTISIPPELTSGKTHITVKLHAKRENIAGGIFDLRVVRKKSK